MKVTKKQLRQTIRRVIRESYFHNKYGQPIGSRFQGGQLYQGGYKPKPQPDRKFHQMRALLKDYAYSKCHWASLGNDMYMNGVWVMLAIGVLGNVSCHDGTQDPVKCTIKFQGDELIFTTPTELEEFLSDPKLLKMQQEETKRLKEEYG